jgi:hypothetical protein
MNTKLLCAVLLAVSIGRAEANESQIAGKWAADGRTKGGLGAMLIFADDGSVTSTFGALVDFTYKVDGQTITTTSTDSESGKFDQTAEPYEIVGEKLIVNPADPERRQEMTRVGAAKLGAASIVGLWSLKHYTGTMATMEYTSGGLAQLSVPFMTLKGRYKLQTEELTMEFEGQPSSKQKILLAGERCDQGELRCGED